MRFSSILGCAAWRSRSDFGSARPTAARLTRLFEADRARIWAAGRPAATLKVQDARQHRRQGHEGAGGALLNEKTISFNSDSPY